MKGSASKEQRLRSAQSLAQQQGELGDPFVGVQQAPVSCSGPCVAPQQNSDHPCDSPDDSRERSASHSCQPGQGALSETESPHKETESCAQSLHRCNSFEQEELSDPNSPQQDVSCETCCECGGECHRDPFTSAVNQSVARCLDNLECSFDRPNGEGLASCCMSCGASNAPSRCSRCRQVPTCLQACYSFSTAKLLHVKREMKLWQA